MIGGGDVSPFAGIFTILTIFMAAAAVGLIVGVVIMIVLAVKNRASQNNMIQTMPMKRFCICLVAGSVSSFLVSGCLSMLPTAMSSVVGVIIFFLVIAAYSALLFFLIYKPLEAKVGKSYALVGGSDFFCCVCCIGNGLVRAFTGVRAVFQKGHARIFNLHSVQKSLTNPNGRRKIKGTSINAVKQDTFYGRLHRRELPGGARQHV